MFDNPEIKSLRQDTDVLTEQITNLIEIIEQRHAEVMNKLELIEQRMEIGEDIGGKIEEKIDEIQSGIEDVMSATESIDSQLEEKES